MFIEPSNCRWSRRLVLIDAENLARSPRMTTQDALNVVRKLEKTFPINSMDIVYVAANPGNAFAVEIIAHELGGSICLRHGKNGAEKALRDVALQLPDSAIRSTRYPVLECVICSGDHFFVGLAQQLVDRGLSVRVVSQKECLSKSLARLVNDVMYLNDLKKI